MDDDVSIYVGNQKISGWTKVRVTRGIERMPADFAIEMTEYYSGDNSSVTVVPGSPCQLFMGSDLILTGYVDSYETRFEGDNHIIDISGRSMSEDLVDCSSEWPNAQILHSPVLQIVQNLASYYGISVSQNSIPDVTKNTIPNIVFMYGETGIEVIDRICRYAQLLYYDMPDGSILLTTASSVKTASGFQEGVNVQSASFRATMTRFKNYICVFQSVITMSDGLSENTGQNNSINQFATVVDSSVQRNRKKYLVVEAGDVGGDDNGDFPVTRRRALWEANRRYGKAFEARIVTDGWRDSAGNLWSPNMLADISLPSLKLPNATWLISEVTYSRDEKNGTTATLILNPPQAFIPEPIVLIPQMNAEFALTSPNASTSDPAPQNAGGGKITLPPPANPADMTAAPELTKGQTANQLDALFLAGGPNNP